MAARGTAPPRRPAVERISRSIAPATAPTVAKKTALSFRTRTGHSAAIFKNVGAKRTRGFSIPYVFDSNLSQVPNRDVIHAHVPLGHDLFQLPEAERISQVPPNAEDDDIRFEMPLPEQCWPVPSHAGQSLRDPPNAIATQP